MSAIQDTAGATSCIKDATGLCLMYRTWLIRCPIERTPIMALTLATLLESPPLPRYELAQRAGISRNTEWSIRDDQSRARLETLRELALACGYDIDVVLRAAYEPAAAAAARQMLGDLDVTNDDRERLFSVLGIDLDAELAALPKWSERLQRYADAGTTSTMTGRKRHAPVDGLRVREPLAVAVEAAHLAAPQHAPGALMLSGRNDLDRLMSAAMAASELYRNAADAAPRFRHQWAFSGWPALEALGAVHPVSVFDLEVASPRGKALPAVIWTSLPKQFGQFLTETHRKVSTVRAATVIIAPLAPHQLIGTGELVGAPLVSPVQAVIDSLGVGGELGTAALDLARGW
ncbi:hypothetical protein [Agromyces bracchium]|uniref:Uncharacterized protein n=1 Tax=Agromyces bracchium TaxID=88376 RepID=A0A6I3MB37_9MICO|nr:hypothetical protein [Agromyces bracchium]MTH70221.1 hypothetical protein [Agromyces bracchium]